MSLYVLVTWSSSYPKKQVNHFAFYHLNGFVSTMSLLLIISPSHQGQAGGHVCTHFSFFLLTGHSLWPHFLHREIWDLLYPGLCRFRAAL